MKSAEIRMLGTKEIGPAWSAAPCCVCAVPSVRCVCVLFSCLWLWPPAALCWCAPVVLTRSDARAESVAALQRER